jgi:hypothetical protein
MKAWSRAIEKQAAGIVLALTSTVAFRPHSNVPARSNRIRRAV